MSLYVRTVGEEDNKAVVAPDSVLAWGEYIYTVAGWTKEDVLRCILYICIYYM